jgi:serine/threonine protein kinase
MTATVQGPLAIGAVFLGKYEIRSLIGRGGHACVYHAVNSFMGRHVAIKVLHRPGGVEREALRRGQAEAQLLNRLRHPNIVEVSDAGMTDDGLLYIVMELLEGRSLREVLNEHGALSVEEALGIAGEIAEGLHAAHATGAIHRDLKPENVFVTRTGAVKILDFGIAKVADLAAWTTDEGTAHGTVLYMSPEQLQLAKLTPRSDIYALGVVTYELLLGRHPVPMLIDSPQPTVFEISRAVLTREPPLLDELDPRIPRGVAALVSRAMAKWPEMRFESMLELSRELRESRDAWRAYNKVHGIPLVNRALGGGAPSSGSPVVASQPPPAQPASSARKLLTPGTAAPVTTRTTPFGGQAARRSPMRAVVVGGCLVGAAVGGVVGWLRLHPGPSEAPKTGVLTGATFSTTATTAAASDVPVPAPTLTAAPPAPPALGNAQLDATAAAPVPIHSKPRAASRPGVKTTPSGPSQENVAPREAPAAEPRKPVDRVDLRLKRLEQSLGAEDSRAHP